MLEPNGPLPPEIYWRRRVFAIGALVVALALVIWLVIAVARSGGAPEASGSETSTTETASSAPVTSSSEPTPTTTESSAESTSSSAEEAAAGQCSDQSLAVKVTVEQPTYQVGDQPVFGIVITNISSQACARDAGSGLQRVSVHTLDGTRQLWSSTDCYPDGEPDVRTLQPGEQAAFQVTWSGSTSQPQCAGERLAVPAGAYNVVAELGSIRSAPEPFNLA